MWMRGGGGREGDKNGESEIEVNEGDDYGGDECDCAEDNYDGYREEYDDYGGGIEVAERRGRYREVCRFG